MKLPLMPQLRRIDLNPTLGPVPRRIGEFIAEAAQIGRGIDCFDYVPSSPTTLHAHLLSLPRGRFCEWGSGMGIGVAIAEMLGFDPIGLELSPALVEASRQLLARYDLQGEIRQGDYLDTSPTADVYFVYCWPGQANRVRQRFLEIAPPDACLLFCDGAERVVGYRMPGSLGATMKDRGEKGV